MFLHHLFQIKGSLGIQTSQGFIQDPNIGIRQECSDDKDFLTHSVRKSFNNLIAIFSKIKNVQ
ncbi:Uncharacterised protein [Mycobacterium tuberculosis]|nr:Uncharacterised protein [Mycobacterium tuberculosis]